MYILAIRSVLDFRFACNGFYGACVDYADVLGLDSEELADLYSEIETFATKAHKVTEQRAALKGAVTDRNKAHKALRKRISTLERRFLANNAVPDAVLAELQLPPHAPGRSSSALPQPTKLIAESNGEGSIRLKWKRSGAPRTTVFMIEKWTPDTDRWEMIGGTTRTTIIVKAQVGAPIGLRVKASKSKGPVCASTPVFLWLFPDTTPAYVWTPSAPTPRAA